MKTIGFWLCLLILIAGLLPPPVRAQDQPPAAPYLFYYSATQNAFTIERADGSDSRPFAAGEMAPDTEAVNGPGWSPSGKWFAWTSTRLDSEKNIPSHVPHALSVDGSRRVSALDAYHNAWLQWSPAEDVLLLTGHDYASIQDPITGQHMVRLYAALIDPAADRVIASWVKFQPYDRIYDPRTAPLPDGQWTADGQYAVVSFSNRFHTWSEPDKPLGTVFHVLGRQGQAIDKTFPGPLVSAAPSPRQVMYFAGNALVIEDLISGERATIEQRPPFVQFLPYEWSPDGRYGLVKGVVCSGDSGNCGGCGIRIDSTGSSDICGCSDSATTCGDQLWLLRLDEHRFDLIWPHVFVEIPGNQFGPAWSPDGREIVFPDTGGIFYAFNVNTQKITALTPPVKDRHVMYFWWGWYWLSQNRIILPGESLPATDDVFFDLAGKPTLKAHFHPSYIYDFSTGQRTQIDAALGDPPVPRLSADERYAASVWDGAIIDDLVTHTQRKLAPGDENYRTINTGNVIWHPDQDWMIIWDDATIAGGSGGYSIIVANAAGTLRRDLDWCWKSDLCADWLPQQVNPADLAPGQTPVLPTPAMTLAGSHWSWLLSWSPDGRRLFAGLSPSEYGLSSLWDAANGTELMTLGGIDWTEEIRWQSNQAGNTLPVLIHRDGFKPDCNHLATSPDSSQVVTCTAIIDARTGARLLEFGEEELVDKYRGPHMVSFSPDGKLFAAPISGKASAVYVWNTSTWQVVAKIDGFHTAAAFSPDGTRLAVAHSWTIDLWNVADLLAQDLTS